MTNAERQKRYRDRLRGGPPIDPELMPCGTYAAYIRHKRAQEEPCEPCVKAFREYHRDRRREPSG